MKKFFNKFKNNKGNSLAEFAVTAAMMATLATTAAPAFSGVADAAKEKQTIANMDRIAGMINQYYSNKSASVGTSDLAEGRGRIPGQQNFEVQLGGYSTLDEVVVDLTAPDGGEAPYNKWDSGEGSKWLSVFGTSTVDPNYLGGVQDYPTGNDGVNTYYQYDEMLSMLQAEEGIITSPFGEGHYIYVVIPGGVKYYVDETTGAAGTVTCNGCGPIVVIADAYDPAAYHKIQSFQ